MKTRPAIFTAEEVRATLDGRKSQFRRVIKPRHDWHMDKGAPGVPWPYYDPYVYVAPGPVEVPCPFGVPGDRLWVRETWALGGDYANGLAAFVPKQERSPDWIRYRSSQEKGLYTGRWRSSSQMPKWASRLTLDVTGVRVERVQEICAGDAIAEGWPGELAGHSWESNPWVWVVEFEVVK